MPSWAKALAPVAERVAHMLGTAMEGKYVATTPLTTRRHRAAQAAVKERKAPTAKQRPASTPALPLWSCPDCGGLVENGRHVLCPECQEKAGHTSAVRQSRGRAIAARKALLKASAEGLGFPADKEWYRANVLPRLAGHKLSELMECGISKGYASYIRAGKFVPHVSTWPALARLTGVELPNGVSAPEPRRGSGMSPSHPASTLSEGR
jgi:hypothetical protein